VKGTAADLKSLQDDIYLAGCEQLFLSTPF